MCAIVRHRKVNRDAGKGTTMNNTETMRGADSDRGETRMRAENNKKILLDLYNAVVARDFDAVESLLHEDFVEHNPGVAHDPGRSSGRQAFIDYFRKGDTPLSGAKVDIKRMIADDDYALVHYHLVNAQHPRGLAVVDILRVIDGRFSEHWDVLQEIPQSAANPHTMF